MKDFISIYNLIDDALNEKLNRVFNLIRNNDECKQYCKTQDELKLSPQNWTYEGSSSDIKELICFFQDIGEKFKIDKKQIV